jgi:hypothetical protein
MKQYTEEQLAKAILAVENGTSIHQASREWGIPRATLRYRLSGSRPHQIAHESQQRLSIHQENELAHWILSQANLGLPPTHSELKVFAQRVLNTKGDSTPLGKRWVASFLKRNPGIKVLRSRRMDAKRTNGATTEVIRQWFRLLAIPEIQAIQPANRWNMDEAGLIEGQGENGLVLGSTNNQSIQRKDSGSRLWTSIIECISANGDSIPPLIIFKGKSVQQQWFPTDITSFEGWQFTATKNAWTDNAVALEWLQKLFIPRTQPRDSTQKRLLILDGHQSHATTEFMWECYQNNILLLYLPPHTSHVLQPLDLGVFSSLKRTYRIRIGQLHQWEDTTIVGKRQFLKTYQLSRVNGLSASNIKSGWKATGLWPVSMSKPLMSPLLLENSQQRTQNKAQISLKDSKRPEVTPLRLCNGEKTIWSTPRKSKDLREQFTQFNKDSPANQLSRPLFRKVTKGFDEKDYQLTQALKRIQVLEGKIEGMRPQKRKKVELSPNSKFASINDIYRTQEEANQEEDNTIIEPDIESIDSEQDCIIVA